MKLSNLAISAAFLLSDPVGAQELHLYPIGHGVTRTPECIQLGKIYTSKTNELISRLPIEEQKEYDNLGEKDADWFAGDCSAYLKLYEKDKKLQELVLEGAKWRAQKGNVDVFTWDMIDEERKRFPQSNSEEQKAFYAGAGIGGQIF